MHPFQVPLGIIQCSEINLDDMCTVMEEIHHYVPRVPARSEDIDFAYHNVILGGDQFTAARIRSSQAIRSMEDSSVDRFEGLLGVPQDWHAQVTVLKVY